MAYSVNIPITNHAASCTDHYMVEYKRQGDVSYNQLYPYPTGDNFTLNDLQTGVYNVRVSRICCSGETSSATPLNVNIP